MGGDSPGIMDCGFQALDERIGDFASTEICRLGEWRSDDPRAFMGTNPLELATGRIHPAQSEWRSGAIAHRRQSLIYAKKGHRKSSREESTANSRGHESWNLCLSFVGDCG